MSEATACIQFWHSDGSLPKDPKHGTVTYGLVVYIPLRSVPENGGRVEYLPKTHKDHSRRVERHGQPWTNEWTADIVVPPMDAGTAVIYSYTTMHRGRASTLPGFYRPVLKLDYFRSIVTENNNKDGWCETNGFLFRQDFVPPTIDWFDAFHHWWPLAMVLVLTLGGGYLWVSSSRNTKRKGGGKLKPKRL